MSDSSDELTESRDELAGIVDLFGALTRAELRTAVTEIAYKRGEEPEVDAIDAAIQRAIDAYALVEVDPESGVVGGPVDEFDDPSQGSPRSKQESLGSKQESLGPDQERLESDQQFLVPGPTAFSTLPPAAEDLPHIMDVPDRTIDRGAVGDSVLDRLREEATAIVEADDPDRAEQLLDVTYDVEAWTPVDAGGVRDTLDAYLEEHAE